MNVDRIFFCLAFLYALFISEVTTINLRSLERSSSKKKALFRRVFSGKYLDKPKLAQYIVDNFRECGILCFKDAACYSFNYQRNWKNCELLSVESMDAKMSDFVDHSDSNYYDNLSGLCEFSFPALLFFCFIYVFTLLFLFFFYCFLVCEIKIKNSWPVFLKNTLQYADLC